ncbi:nucleoside phosphorylase domain-containing protein [Microdochium trichocladiopsis]|uniref:Nucleoside phosphorylase domain-containing protein n=1 Tax=Microdochium trichocladiopsis TaxID=1682393 RepID=A0A9P9BJL0_9PEZI|nr:nucleoside phosphorylase domain-containing protein [Microdochium trichocladiopsis]KAH7016089.1 nucleoside phosphorylase domain-containing protein [Microdochium trichocladiopsis]
MATSSWGPRLSQSPVPAGEDGRSRALPAASPQPPRSRHDFAVVIVCAVPLEYDAVSLLFDLWWRGPSDRASVSSSTSSSSSSYGKAAADTNTYAFGRIGHHNVALTLLPGMGKVNAAGAAMGIKASFPHLQLVLLPGVCGGVPRVRDSKHEILLGDVLISDGVLQYDLGRQYPDGFVARATHRDRLARPNREIRTFLSTLGSQLGMERLQETSCNFLRDVQSAAKARGRRPCVYPGAAHDKLYRSDYRHRHHRGDPNCICHGWRQSSDPVCEEAFVSPCTLTNCGDEALVQRHRLELRKLLESKDVCADTQGFAVFMGRFASGDTVMKSAEDRDRIAAAEQVIAFEMEAAGLWDELHCIVLKGVCDYADSHKSKGWQDFAAATAAATTKAILELFLPTDSVSYESSVEKWDVRSSPQPSRVLHGKPCKS